MFPMALLRGEDGERGTSATASPRSTLVTNGVSFPPALNVGARCVQAREVNLWPCGLRPWERHWGAGAITFCDLIFFIAWQSHKKRYLRPSFLLGGLLLSFFLARALGSSQHSSWAAAVAVASSKVAPRDPAYLAGEGKNCR